METKNNCASGYMTQLLPIQEAIMASARKGFSIIEVLMAVVIASIAGMALMESAAQGRRAYDTAVHHRYTAEASELIAFSVHTMGGIGQGDTASLLSSRYFIDNSRIREILQSHKYTVTTQRSHPWNGSNETNTTHKAIASISKNAIEKTIIDINGVSTSLYGLNGEGW
jgi:prepilin-type N-terminal cleavage/methylation domain-containing protein